MAHVVALDPQRGMGKVEILLQLVERTSTTVVIAAALEPMPSEALLCVLRDRRMELALVASLRNPDGDLALTQLRQPLLVQRRIRRQFGDEDLLRPTDGVVVEVQPLEHPTHELRPIEFLSLVDDETATSHDPALSDEEHLHGRFEFIVVDPDDIGVLVLREHHLLLLDGLADGRQTIAEMSGELELEVL